MFVHMFTQNTQKVTGSDSAQLAKTWLLFHVHISLLTCLPIFLLSDKKLKSLHLVCLMILVPSLI